MPSHRTNTVRCFVLLSAVVLVLAGCTSVITASGSRSTPASGSSTPATSTATIAFSDCSKLFDINSLDLPAKRAKTLQIFCGKLAVPLNYNDPTSRKINIEVLKVHDTTVPKKAGDLLMNPGGPGVPGLTLPLDLLSNLSDSIIDNFDLIGFDPRGVELSSPISCISNATKDALIAANPDVRTAAGFAAAKAQQAAVAAGCSAKYGASLPFYNTLFTAMDMEQIRLALGDPQLNYLGFSYGTELGAVYAHLYPKTIRVAVLDGAVDPLADPISASAAQLQGFESEFDDFAADCLTRPSCAVLGNPRQVVEQLVAKADVTPIKSDKAGETRAATGGDILYGVLSALYTTDTWPTLGDAIVQAEKGDSQGLLALSDQYNERQDNGAFTNSIDATTTIGCNDSPAGPTDAQISSTAAVWAVQYPMFGLWSAASLFTCQAWQAARTVPPVESAVGSAPILVVGGTHDPATPYQGAVNLAKTLTTGQVLTWQGFGHTAYGRGSSCIDNAVNTYLVSTQMPPAGTVCPA